MVETTLNYLAPMTDRPYYYLYEPPAGTPWRNTNGDRRRVAIEDAREISPRLSLDEQGFALADHDTAIDDFYDPGAVRGGYYRAVEALVARVTGASRSSTSGSRSADRSRPPRSPCAMREASVRGTWFRRTSCTRTARARSIR